MPLHTGSPSRAGAAPPRGDWRRAPLTIAVAVTVAVAALAGLYEYVHSAATGPAAADTLRGQLAAQLVTQLERSTPAEHASHGHDLGAEPGRVLCTVEVYGVDPAGATTPARVTHAYGYHLCAIGSSEFVWDLAPKLVGPIVVDYSTQPPSIQVVESGEGYPERLARMIPARFQDQARHGFTNGQTVADLRQRYNTVIPKA
jgi:hypothetical protein